MLCANGELISYRHDHLPLVPVLLMSNEPYLGEDVVKEDFDDIVVPGVDFATRPLAAADDVPCVQLRTCSATEALRLGLLRNNFLPLSNTEEVLLDLSDYLLRLQRR